MKLKINLKGNLKDIQVMDALKKNISVVLLSVLLVVLLLVGYVMYGEIKKISLARSDNSAANIGKIQRVNVGQHQDLQKKLDDNASFIPSEVPNAEAFSAPPTSNAKNP